MALYYYAPSETDGDNHKKPVGDIPPCVRALVYDESLSRFALEAHDIVSRPVPDGWTLVDAALVEQDYPGVLGGE